MRRSIVVGTLGAFAFALASTAAAQDIPGFGTTLTLTATPEHPAPKSAVSIALSSFSTDLARSGIRWYLNGAAVPGADDTTTLSAQTGPLGSATRITAVVMRADGSEASREIVLRPATLDLLWEADSYVPPLYRGRALPSPGSSTRFEAVATLAREDGVTLSAQEIIYSWKLNGALVPAASGRGKARAMFPAPALFSTDTVAVEAASIDGDIVATASVRISSAEPQLLLYEDHPLFGTIYHRALEGGTRLTSGEATFTAAPYFLPVRSMYDRSLAWNWRVNGNPIATDANDPNRLTVRGGGATRATIELAVTHARNWFLDARGMWDILIGQGSEERNSPFTSGQVQ